MRYARVDGETILQDASFGGGRILASEGESGYVYTPNYYITDHLGSTRAVVELTAGSTVNVTERSDFYPFGARHINPAAAITDNRYRFSGKEDQESIGLHFQDFGARMYDSHIGRWWSIDPLAGKTPWFTPYLYCSNNPLNRIDPTGLFDIKTGTIEKGDNLTKITKQINGEYGTKLTINDIAKANNIGNANKIQVGDKIALPGQNSELSFDLESLKVTDATYNIDMPGLSWEGASGREGYQSSEFQSTASKGPIPEGSYMVDPARTQSYSSISTWDKLKGDIGLGTWPGGKDSWGEHRTWLTPAEGTNTYGRSGFSIHGGTTPGSAGCIDLTGKNNSFHNWLKSYGKPIKLNVQYGK